jgi:hypothetical protein
MYAVTGLNLSELHENKRISDWHQSIVRYLNHMKLGRVESKQEMSLRRCIHFVLYTPRFANLSGT